MRFLIADSRDFGEPFGVLATRRCGVTYSPILRGAPWGADNECFAGKFSESEWRGWLVKMEPWKSTCLFATIPDVLGDAKATLGQWGRYPLEGWPKGYVAQDGSESLPIPDDCSCVFIGGSTQWKCSPQARQVVEVGLSLGKHIHIGRVNYRKRYNLFASIGGSDDFTCDGTRFRFEGMPKTLKAWRDYMGVPLPCSDSVGESVSHPVWSSSVGSERLPIHRA